VLDRNPSGSSSGTAAGVAAGFAPLGIGTETDGSIISPAGVCGIVGIKPTVGLWSRSGIVPISASQDTPGPMARTVGDAALLLAALAGPADPEDVATRAASAACRALAQHDGARAAGAIEAGLVGARLGVPRDLAGFHPEVDAALERALGAMKAAGAVIVDHLALGPTARLEEAEMEVLLYELKDGLARYLARRGSSAGGLGSLADVIAFNARERTREMPWFGQELFERAQKKGDLTAAGYGAARVRCLALARTRGLDALLARHRLDALVCPSNAPAWLTDLENGDHVTGGNTTFAAVAGYPSIAVPMGAAHGLPLGLSFVGAAWTEPRLIALAAGFEAITRARVPPRFLPTLAMLAPLVEPAGGD
jgi:amidase